MQTKRKMNWIVLLMLCYFVGLNVFAADTSTGPGQFLRPCIDDQTFAVVHLDVEKLNLDALVDQVLSSINKHASPNTTKQMQNDLKTFQAQAGAQLNDLLKAGCRDIFVVFSMYDFPYFFVAVPIHSASEQDKLNQHIELYQQIQKITKDFNVGNIELYVSDGMILAGLERTIARLKTVSPVQSETLGAGFQSCANSTVQVVLFPSSDQRRVMAEMLPQIPSESGMIELTTLAKDLHWAALGFNTPPSVSMNLTIQCPNAEGADRMLIFVKNLYALIGQNPEVREFLPELDQVLKLLTPQRHDKRLILQVDSTAVDLIINDFIAPSLLKVNATVTRYSCAANLRGIGMALYIYANDYDDQFPSDLEKLIQAAEMPANGLVCPNTKLKDSYIYRGATLTTPDSPLMIMVYDKKGNHEDGRYVLFLDNQVDLVTEERFMELIEEDNEYRREKGLPVIPAQ